MDRSAHEILEEARKLPPADRDWLIENLLGEQSVISDEVLADWQNEAGEPESGYDEWFRAGVEEALADTSGDIPHEEAMKQFHDAIRRAKTLKRTA
jgi:hypothetical protein